MNAEDEIVIDQISREVGMAPHVVQAGATIAAAWVGGIDAADPRGFRNLHLSITRSLNTIHVTAQSHTRAGRRYAEVSGPQSTIGYGQVFDVCALAGVLSSSYRERLATHAPVRGVAR